MLDAEYESRRSWKVHPLAAAPLLPPVLRTYPRCSANQLLTQSRDCWTCGKSSLKVSISPMNSRTGSCLPAVLQGFVPADYLHGLFFPIDDAGMHIYKHSKEAMLLRSSLWLHQDSFCTTRQGGKLALLCTGSVPHKIILMQSEAWSRWVLHHRILPMGLDFSTGSQKAALKY